MSTLRYYYKYEKILEKINLDYLQSILDIDVSVTDLMKSINATELSFTTIFGMKNMRLESISDNPEFVDKMKNLDIQIGEYNDSSIYQTSTKFPIRWRFLYKEDMPIYIIFKYYEAGKWSDMKLYLVQDDITNFYDMLTTIVIEMTHISDTKYKWFYQSNDSGNQWYLQDTVKKQGDIYNSHNKTTTFRDLLTYDDIFKIIKRPDINVVVY